MMVIRTSIRIILFAIASLQLWTQRSDLNPSDAGLATRSTLHPARDRAGRQWRARVGGGAPVSALPGTGLAVHRAPAGSCRAHRDSDRSRGAVPPRGPGRAVPVQRALR